MLIFSPIAICRIAPLLLLLLLTSCDGNDSKKPKVQTIPDKAVVPTLSFSSQVEPILNNRCAVCHGCYDAPCQLKLSSIEGLERGANKAVVYNGTRLIADQPSRLFVDAGSTSDWRKKDFFTVLADAQTENIKESVMYRMLSLKEAFPLPAKHNEKLQADLFEFRLARENVCPTQDEMDDFTQTHQLHGMPFGLPALDDKEQAILLSWLEQGAMTEPKPPLDATYLKRIENWEAFLNGDSNKARLMARYIYEHLFIGHLYFSDLSDLKYFELVRSTTPPGEPIRIIATRRPFDDPMTDASISTKVERVYYRLRPVKNAIVVKQHMPYALNPKRLERFENLFLTPDYTVEKLPGYSSDIAANPFETFHALPSRSRYRFMIEQSKFTIRGFMKGAVCRGQVALNVINDSFWVFFANPDEAIFSQWNDQLPNHIDQLDLPAERSSTAGLLAHWTEYSESQSAYLKSKSRSFEQESKAQRPALDWVWDGDGNNENASLTVFRHFDSASVVKGLVGQPPKTAWLIDYPILERIHYLLVAGFDVYGNGGHQLSTRLYMEFLRMESEFNFLMLLPPAARLELRDYWYRGADEQILNYIYGNYAHLSVAPNIDYAPEKPAKLSLFNQLKSRLDPVLPEKHLMSASHVQPAHKILSGLQIVKGKAATIMPEMSLLMVANDDKTNALYTILRNSGHSNITSLFLEDTNRLPDEDYLTILPGVVGAYPDALWRVNESELSDFIDGVSQLGSEANFAALMRRFGIRRTHQDFWAHSDTLHSLYQQTEPIEFGLFDFNRLENR